MYIYVKQYTSLFTKQNYKYKYKYEYISHLYGTVTGHKIQSFPVTCIKHCNYTNFQSWKLLLPHKSVLGKKNPHKQLMSRPHKIFLLYSHISSNMGSWVSSGLYRVVLCHPIVSAPFLTHASFHFPAPFTRPLAIERTQPHKSVYSLHFQFSPLLF